MNENKNDAWEYIESYPRDVLCDDHLLEMEMLEEWNIFAILDMVKRWIYL